MDVRIATLGIAALITFFGSVSDLLSQEVQRFGVLPRHSNPGRTFFHARNGYFYGVLTETNLQVSRHPTNNTNQELGTKLPNGAIYEISPTGSLRYLHHFPDVWGDDVANTTGAVPADLLRMGRDGFLYGFTIRGGIHTTGVFYRLGVDGSYEVITHFKGESGSRPYYFNGLCEGPDDAFYVSDTYSGDILRFGLDGTVASIAKMPATTAQLFSPGPGSSSLTITWRARRDPSQPELGDQRTIRRIEIPSGELLEEIIVPALSESSNRERVLTVTEDEVFVYSETSDSNGNAPGRLVSFARDGTATTISEFAAPQVESATLPPHLSDFIVAADGSYYFSAHNVPPLGGAPPAYATRLYRLFRDGTFSKICEFEDTLINIAYGNDHFLYCLSLGLDFVEGEELAAIGSAHLQQGIAQAKIRLSSSGLVPSRARSGTFRVRPITGTASLAPMAKQDILTLRRQGKDSFAPISVRVLKNDRDPERGPLSIGSLGAPRFGSALVAVDKNGAQEITYTSNVSPSSSEIIDYTITDIDGQSSTGQLAVRGDVGGKYRRIKREGDEAQNVDTFVARISPHGRFAVRVAAGGVTIKGSGKLNFSDAARIVQITRSGVTKVLDIRIETSGETKVLKYEFTVGSQTFTGTVARK